MQDLYLKHFRGNFSWFSSWPQLTSAESTHKLCQLKIVQNIAFKNEWTLDYKWYVITHPSLFPLTLLQQWKEKARQERQFVKFRLESWSKFTVFHPYSNQNSWRIQLSSDIWQEFSKNYDNIFSTTIYAIFLLTKADDCITIQKFWFLTGILIEILEATHPSLFPLNLLQQWKGKARQQRPLWIFRLEFWSKFKVFQSYSDQNSWRIQLSSDRNFWRIPMISSPLKFWSFFIDKSGWLHNFFWLEF